MAVYLSRNWRRQPQVACELNRGNVLAKNVLWLADPNTRSNDIVARHKFTYGSATTIEPSRAGRAFSFNQDQTNDFISFSGLANLTGNRGTFFTFASHIRAGDTQGAVWFGSNTGASTYFQVDVGTISYVFGQGVTGVDSANLIFNTRNTSLVFTANATAASKAIYVNGISRGTAGANVPTAFAAGSKNFQFGNWVGDPTGTFHVDADIEIAGYTSDYWTEAEARAFNENPWQLLRPAKKALFFEWTAAPPELLGQACL